MGMTVRFAPRALVDLRDIQTYVVQRSSQGAERLRRALVKAIDGCAVNPERGTRCDQPRLYRWPLHRYPYTIFYRPLGGGDGIEVARVVHGARVRKLGKMPDDE